MKLLLCSEGFHGPNTVQACVALCGKPQTEIKVAIINEAFAVVPGGKRWVLSNLNGVADNFSADIDIVNLLALPLTEVEARLMAADVIFVVGGDTDYLMHVFQKTGFAKLLPKLLGSKVYVGSSAGSIVMGRRVPQQVRAAVYGENDSYGTTEYLGLVNFGFFSHLESANFPNNRPEVLDGVRDLVDYPVYSLRDDAVIIIDGDDVRFTGSAPYTVMPG